MSRAVYLAQYFLGQARWMGTKQNLEEEEGLTGIFAQIQTFALKSQKAIAARDVKQMIASLKKNSKATAGWIREMFSQLANTGYGLLSGEGIHLRYQAAQQNQQNEVMRPNPLPAQGWNPLENVDSPNLQKSTSPNFPPVWMQVTIEDGKTLEGMGYYLDTGEGHLTLNGGMKLVIPPEQHHCLSHAQPNTQNVGPSVETPSENVGPFVDTPDNSLEPTQQQPLETIEEMLAPAHHPLQQQLTSVQPQELLHQLQQAENSQDILKTTQQALTWIMEHLLNRSQNQLVT